MKRKFVSMLLTAVMVTAMLAGCGAEENNGATDAQNAAQVQESSDSTATAENGATDGANGVSDSDKETGTAANATEEGTTDKTANESAAVDANAQKGPTLTQLTFFQEDDGISKSFGGVVMVRRNDLWGAYDLEGNELVPCSYETYRSPNLKGYFVLGNGEERILFDKTGKEIFRGEGRIVASGDYFQFMPPLYEGEENCNYIYDYNGTLVTEANVCIDWANEFSSSFDGKLLLRREHEYEDQNRAVTENGYLLADGSINWVTEYDGDISTDHGSSASHYYYQCLLSGLNHGYFVTYNPYIEWGLMRVYNEQFEYVSEFDLCFLLDENTYSDYYFNEYNDCWGYYLDGATNYNYGSKMVWQVEDRYYLVDVVAPGAEFNTSGVLASFDYITMGESSLWLIQDGEQWGYIDHEGNVVALYDDASVFNNGYAAVIREGQAYLVDEALQEVMELGEASSVSMAGDILVLKRADETVEDYYIQ